MKSKKNKTLLITSIIAFAVAIISLVVGFLVSGVNIFEWLSSSWALLIYSVFGVYLIVVIFILTGDLIKKM